MVKKIVFAFVLASIICTNARDTLAQDRKQVEQPPDNEKEFAAWIKAYADKNSAEIAQLMQSEEITIAINAAWELVQRDIALSPDGYQRIGPKKKISWFLGFVEGRARISPPNSWMELVEEAQFATDSVEPVLDAMRTFRYKQDGRSYFNSQLKVDRAGGRVTVTDQDRSIEVDIPVSRAILPSFISGKIYEDFAVIAFHEGYVTDYDIHSFKNDSSEPVWQQQAWSVLRVGFASGSGGFHHVAISRNSDSVWVFGVTRVGIYLQGHDIDTGRCIARFYSAFFHSRRR